jgi:hypothetical protein
MSRHVTRGANLFFVISVKLARKYKCKYKNNRPTEGKIIWIYPELFAINRNRN